MTSDAYQQDKYYSYEEMTSLLQKWAADYPTLIQLNSIGQSLEGRDIWVVEVTNRESGQALDKPAFYVDANLHAGEVSGSSVALYTIHYLITQYDKDSLVTHLLNTRTFYIIPRISVDGAEVYLSTPQTIRSSTRIRPFFEDEEGIIPEDLTGSGSITMMRVKDPLGEWKISKKDTRVMVRRAPADIQGDFYRLYPEGHIKDFDQRDSVKLAKTKYYLDINRNFPSDWVPTEVSGDFPLSEPETRALAEFIVKHPNITGVISYHTFGGIILRPSATKRDSDLDQHDVHFLEQLAKRGEELTGYPSAGVYEGFNYHNPPKPLPGSFLDWNYEQLGLYSFTTELWDVAKVAGIEKQEKEYARFWSALSEDHQIKLLQWDETENAGQGFHNWVSYEHPQLGQVEIGGWSIKYTLQNPPPKYLEQVSHGNMLFSLEHAAASPLLEVVNEKVTPLGDGLYQIRIDVRNSGYLPTYLSEKAKQKGQVRDIEVHLSGDIEIIEGKSKQSIGHLEGYGKMPKMSFFATPAVQSVKTVSWVLKAEAATACTLQVRSTKAGRIERKISLK